jgi:hypothetical protein
MQDNLRRYAQRFAESKGIPLDVSTRAIEVYLAFERQSHSNAIRSGLRARRRQGLRHTRCPGYGYRWAGPKGRQRRIVDEDEMDLICRMRRWRWERRLSYYSIAAHLLRHGARTSDGREWSVSRVRRAILSVVASPTSAAPQAAG